MTRRASPDARKLHAKYTNLSQGNLIRVGEKNQGIVEILLCSNCGHPVKVLVRHKPNKVTDLCICFHTGEKPVSNDVVPRCQTPKPIQSLDLDGEYRVTKCAASWENQQCGFQTGPTQTGLYKHRKMLEA